MPEIGAQPALAELQRWLARLIAAPEGVRRGLEELGDARGEALAGLVRGDSSLPAERRLEVYANAYFRRLQGVLAEDFGALAAALGTEWFHDLATAYLWAKPPRHFSLREAGARLADFLARDPRAEPFRSRFPWAADLARLEWALVEAFDAPDAPELGREALAALPAARWPGLRLELQPALRVLELAWPVHELRAAFDAGAPLEPLRAAPAASAVCVWRSDERVQQRPLPRDEARALALARRGEPFAALCEAIAAEAGEARAPARAAALLEAWCQRRWIASVG
jgi:hypothetical protein